MELDYSHALDTIYLAVSGVPSGLPLFVIVPDGCLEYLVIQELSPSHMKTGKENSAHHEGIERNCSATMELTI